MSLKSQGQCCELFQTGFRDSTEENPGSGGKIATAIVSIVNIVKMNLFLRTLP